MATSISKANKAIEGLEAEASEAEARHAAARAELEAACAKREVADAAFADGGPWGAAEHEAEKRARVRAEHLGRKASDARNRATAARSDLARAQFEDACARSADAALRKAIAPGIEKLEQARRLAEEGAAALVAAAEAHAAAEEDVRRFGREFGMTGNAIEDAVRGDRGYVGRGADATHERGIDAIRKIAAARLGAFVAREGLAVSRGSVATGARLETWLRAADPAEIHNEARDALGFFLEPPGLLAKLRGA